MPGYSPRRRSVRVPARTDGPQRLVGDDEAGRLLRRCDPARRGPHLKSDFVFRLAGFSFPVPFADAHDGGQAGRERGLHFARHRLVGFPEKVAALKGVVSGDNVEEIKSKSNTLAQVAMKLGEAMYKAQQADQAAGAAAGAAGAAPGDAANKDEKVVDADFEDVTDQKNKKTGSA